MKKSAMLAAFAALFVTGSFDPAAAFVNRNDKPPAGDCRALAAEYGADNLWFGRYSGFLYQGNKAREVPFANQGCFASEAACRRWQNENMTFTRGGSLRYTSCEAGVSQRYL